ncbi:MAG: glycoside hydrolase family 9 protein [Ruminococcus sp.]|nr:glycoside hydrolase family 9 protein [Ruminococcus sp.]MCM1479894.1 glycoside hydrolase family 9 protein [Muribaculaceae bacterium]
MNRKISVNQLGYISYMPKTAAFVGSADSFQIIDTSSGKTMFSGIPNGPFSDDASRNSVSVIDFSTFNVMGEYYIKAGRRRSPVFPVTDNPYRRLKLGLLKSFYFNRCGVQLERRYAGEYARGKCHAELVPLFDKPSEKIDVSGGWHDSGGYGKFSVCTAVTLGHLLYAYRLFPKSFTEKTGIPESGSDMPDILEECKVGLTWLLKMQTRDGGVHHKVSSATKTPIVMPEDDNTVKMVFPCSHQAAACFSAVTSLASRIYKPFDSAFSERLHEASVNAWIWLINHPRFEPFENPPSVEISAAGDFYDNNINDDMFWAVCELYETTGDKAFHDRIAELSGKVNLTDFRNRDNGGFGAMSYLLGSRPKNPQIEELIQVQLRIKADNLYSLSKRSAYGTAKSSYDYIRGSNMYSMTDSMILIFAYKILGCKEYLTTAYEQLNCVLGKNPMDICYITGFGSDSVMHPHHRPSQADDVEEPIPGLLVCGPNKQLKDDDFSRWNIPAEEPPAKCYYDVMYSFSTNESTIYCNSAAVFVTAFFDSLR